MRFAYFVLLAVMAGAGCRTGAAQERIPKPLREAFPRTATIKERPKQESFPAAWQNLWVVADEQDNIGYGLRFNGRTRSGKFVALMILERNLTIRQVLLEKYLGDRGGEIRRRSFLDQFSRKTHKDTLLVGKDIDAISGATMSSRALTDAVRQAVQWFELKP